jgi:hypothetical protein
VARAQYYVLGVDGEPVAVDDFYVWAEWFETADRRVALDVVGLWRISTVFLGIDHGFSFGEHAPVLWETMIFSDSRSIWRDEWCHRYASRADALNGHATTVALVRAEVDAKAHSTP